MKNSTTPSCGFGKTLQICLGLKYIFESCLEVLVTITDDEPHGDVSPPSPIYLGLFTVTGQLCPRQTKWNRNDGNNLNRYMKLDRNLINSEF